MLIAFFVAFSTCQSNVSAWGLFCFRVAGAMQDAPSPCNYGSIIVLAQKHLLSPCHLHFLFLWRISWLSMTFSIFHDISVYAAVPLAFPCLSIYLFFPISISNAFGISAHLLIKSISRCCWEGFVPTAGLPPL